VNYYLHFYLDNFCIACAKQLKYVKDFEIGNQIGKFILCTLCKEHIKAKGLNKGNLNSL
jgi:hypothetical protein